MSSIGNDRIKAVSHKMLLLFSQTVKFFCCTQFCNFFFSYICFQPVNELCYCHAVPDMCKPFIFHLYRILDGFWKKSQILFIQNLHIRRDIAYQTAVDAGFRKKDFLSFRKSLYTSIHFIIRIKLYSICFQIFTYLLWKCHCICKKTDLCICHHQIRKYYRATMNIISTYVQKPCNIIQRSQHKNICFFFFHLLADFLNPGCPGFSGPLYIQLHNLLTGKCRTVIPDFADQILLYRKCDIFFLEKFF